MSAIASIRRRPPNRIRELRLASGLRRVDIAAHVGKDTTTLYRWEKGTQPIPDDDKQVLAELFGVSVAWMMGWESVPGGPPGVTV